MIAAALSDTDVGIAAGVVVILAVLAYRILRREPRDRIVRLGLFIERRRHTGDEEPTDPDWPERPSAF